jgi:hypothetical protein
MKYISVLVCILIGLLALVISISSLASDKQKERPKHKSFESQKKKSVTPVGIPVYKPPLRGAPVGRVGGGTRGAGSEMPILAALVPEHIGLTFQEQPSLYWYLSKPTDYLVEFTLIDEQSIQPLLEKRITPPVQAGVHCVRLADHDAGLSKGKQYKWFVALVLDPEHRSKDIIAGGAIELIDLPEALQAKLAQAEEEKIPNIYAEAGIWYDALSAISGLIDAAPNDQFLRRKRASLLKQVGLSQVADNEMKTGDHGSR